MSCSACERAKQALNKASNIVEGYTNLAKSLIVSESDIEQLANKRIMICSTCINKNPLVKVGGSQYYMCSKCYCPLDAKVRSTGEQCPIGKW